MATRMFRGLAIIGAVAAILVSGLAALALVVGGHFEAFLAVSFGGGLATALLMIATSAHPRPAPAFHDPFANDLIALDPMNLAHVRVAGVGGLGLLLVTAAVALQYQLLTLALVSGVVGGALCAGGLILYRKTRRRP